VEVPKNEKKIKEIARGYVAAKKSEILFYFI